MSMAHPAGQPNGVVIERALVVALLARYRKNLAEAWGCTPEQVILSEADDPEYWAVERMVQAQGGV